MEDPKDDDLRTNYVSECDDAAKKKRTENAYGYDKAVAKPSSRVCELVCKLDPVMIKPTTVKSTNRSLRKYGSKKLHKEVRLA